MPPPGTGGAGPPWHALAAGDVAGRLDSDPVAGLDEAEARRRLERFGPNELPRTERSGALRILLRQFAGAFTLILVVAAVLSALLGEAGDAIAIVAILLLNGGLGFAQEWRAERALDALRRMLEPTTTVIRGGTARSLEVRELVPGDLVEILVGARVPADLRLVDTTALTIDEAPLTGESAPVRKTTGPTAPATAVPERASMAWMGTSVTRGSGVGIVVGTATATELGRIATLTRTVDTEPTPLQRKLGRLGGQVGLAALGLAALVAALGYLRGYSLVDMVLTAVSLAVAVVPEGLPAIVTIVLALGARAMAGRRALVRRLAAAETLGSATVICTDKTGTLTRNEMTLRRLWMPAGSLDATGAGYDARGRWEANGVGIDPADRPDLAAALETGVACNRARFGGEDGRRVPIGDPTEAALLVAAAKARIAPAVARVAEFPFSSERQRMTVVAQTDTGLRAHVKGAPETVLARCTHVLDGTRIRRMEEEDRRAAAGAYREMAGEGYRTLALARRDLDPGADLKPADVETGLTLLGIAAIFDPPRREVPAAVALARSAGIDVVMITGDAPGTALSVARSVGLDARLAVTGTEIEGLDDDELLRRIDAGAVFARTMPEQKLRIVTLLRGRGEIVAMTGDGVNDAPALRRADIGVAMGVRGTDVARDAADMTLTDDDFATLIGAVEEGRRQFDNIRKFVYYLLSSNAGEVIAIVGAVVLGGPLILLPVQILWMNLVTDGVTALALGLEPGEPRAMRRPPRDPAGPIVSGPGLAGIAALGLYIGGATLWAFMHYRAAYGPEGVVVAQTVAFTTIILIEKMNVLNFRSLSAPLGRDAWLSNRWLVGAWTSMIGLHVAVVYLPFFQRVLHTRPLAPADWLHAIALALPVFLVVESGKWALARRRAGAK